MPLHLLGKKSWNVYNTDNIERVKRDEAILAAHEEEVDRINQEHDAAKRAVLLRGLPPPRTPTPPPAPDFSRSKPDASGGAGGAGGSCNEAGRGRKRRKLRGEDDTEMEMRFAKQDFEDAARAKERLTEKDAKSEAKRKEKTDDVSLYDHRGHINLFPEDNKAALKDARKGKNEEVEREKKRKEKELEDQYTMRFSNAAGRNSMDEKPWYADEKHKAKSSKEKEGEEEMAMLEGESKNVWGRPDPGRREREQKRTAGNDPLAFMNRAQGLLKKSEQEKKIIAEKKERALREVEEMDKGREIRKKRRRENGTNVNDNEEDREGRRRHGSSRHKHGHRRSRSRSKERRQEYGHSKHRHSSHRYRSRSQSRERDGHRHGR